MSNNSELLIAAASVTRMEREEAERTTALFEAVLAQSPYYNAQAKFSELAKYSAARLRESVSNDPDSVLIAKVDRKLVGFCFSHKDDDLIWLSWFGVHLDYRRKGIGRAFLQALDLRAQTVGSHKIWCDCRTDNQASKLTLTDQKYQPLCVVRNHWYGLDFVLWEKFVA